MWKKVTRIILFSFLGLAVVILGAGYRLYLSADKAVLDGRQQSNKDFLDFSAQKSKLPQASGEVSLIAVGDVSYSRGVERIVNKQNDVNYPFLKIADYLKGADLVFGNLEAPITEGREIQDFEMVFRSNPGTEQALKQAGFSVLSLANNHALDFGEQGLKDTVKFLESAGIKHAGAGMNGQEAGQPAYAEAKGMKFAFLAYNDPDVASASSEAGNTHAGTAFMRSDKMTEAVREAKQKADFVIISMHSGIEYVGEPDDSQVNFARAAIDAGADLVIGHHPHVVQTMERYKGEYIFYSLGNFVFDQPFSEETKEGLTVKAYFTKDGISKISLLPVAMENFAQPQVANGDEAKKILERLKFPLAERAVYFWNASGNDFEKASMAAIYNDARKNGAAVQKKEQADLDNNSAEEIYSLENGRLAITENPKAIWQSPPGWWIDDFVLADSNNDGVKDVNLSVWKPGDFGPSKPFWVKENDMSIKNHFFIFDLVGGVMKPIWQSSNLEAPNCGFTFADVRGDGENDLITVEGDYSQKPGCNGNHVAVWEWNGWGFSNDWRSEKGNFSGLEVEKIDGENYIVVD